MHLVNEVHLVAAASGRVLDVIGQFPHIIDAGTGGGVNLDQIHKPAFLDLLATGAFTAGIGRDAGFAVQAAGEQTTNGGLAYPTGPREQIGVMKTLAFQSVNQRLEHVFLAHHILEGAWAPFTGKYLVAHVPPTAVKNGSNLSTDEDSEEANLGSETRTPGPHISSWQSRIIRRIKTREGEKTGGDSTSDTPAHNSTAAAAPFRA